MNSHQLSSINSCTVSSQSSCFSGITNFESTPLPTEDDAQYLTASSIPMERRQVIIPQMKFNCVGYITSWSARTLILAGLDSIEHLTHIITFQVWRPDSRGQSYSLVGSNTLRFSGETLREGITPILSTNSKAFFSFNNATVPENERIYFMQGDVIGWLVLPAINTINPPLSPLYRNPAPSMDTSLIVNLNIRNITRNKCLYCSITQDFIVVSSIVPLISVTFGKQTFILIVNQHGCV